MHKTEIPGIYKANDGVLINRDNDALQKYKNKKELLRAKENKINRLEEKVDSLSSDIEEIKNLLKKLAK
jgi:hypothetical protein